MKKTYCVYMLTNDSRTVIYTGMTNSLKRRMHEHQNPFNEGFTKKYSAHKLVYFETFLRPSDAIEREKQIKKGSRAKKLFLIENFNKGWEDLSSLL